MIIYRRPLSGLQKGQMTWFRRDTEIHWLDMEQEYFDEACELLDGFYTK